jgi:hypothetical protein
MKRPYVEWNVGENTYKLKLSTLAIVEIERYYNNRSLISLVSDQEIVTSFDFMCNLFYFSSKKYEKLKASDIYDLIDEYLESGKTVEELNSEILMPLIESCGFFGKTEKEKKARTPKNPE